MHNICSCMSNGRLYSTKLCDVMSRATRATCSIPSISLHSVTSMATRCYVRDEIDNVRIRSASFSSRADLADALLRAMLVGRLGLSLGLSLRSFFPRLLSFS